MNSIRIFAIIISLSISNFASIASEDNYQKKLIYTCTFETEDALNDWVVEGPGSIEMVNGKMIACPEFQPFLYDLWKQKRIFQDEKIDYYDELEPVFKEKYGNQIKDYYYADKGLRGGHIQIWNKKPTPDNYIIEYDFRSLCPLPLHLISFSAKGLDGESIFDETLKPRNGVAAQYMYGDIRNYRISFFAGSRSTANMRKAPGRLLVAKGPDIAARNPYKTHKIKLVKLNDTVNFFVDGEQVIKFKDKEPLDGGFWGPRLMATAKGMFDNFKIYELSQTSNENAAVKNIDLISIHPEKRQKADPANGKMVKFNPVRLLWPSAEGKNINYTVNLSQSENFSDKTTITSRTKPWAFYNHHKKLDTGKWYWKYAVIEQGQKPKWSKTYSFTIPEDAISMQTPTSKEVIKSCPETHPRLLIQASRLEDFRRNAIKKPEADNLKERAESVLRDKFPSPENIKPDKSLKSPAKINAYWKKLSHKLTRTARYQLETLNKAYLLTGDNKFADEAIKRTMEMARWDKSKLKGDFPDGAMINSFSFTYDSCYNLLSETQKRILRKEIRVLGNRFYGRFVNRLESDIFDNHAWQHTLRYLKFAAFATLGEIPEAEKWVEYTYGLWIARAPGLGGLDGAWHNGDSYFHVNIESLVYIPLLYRNLVGLNLFEHPWYQNVTNYVIYSQPPHSKSAGFGSSHELKEKPADFRVAFADVLRRETQNPFAAQYVKDELNGNNERLIKEKNLLWYRLQSPIDPEKIECKSFDKLPKAYAFRDTGIGFMDTNLQNPSKNLMLSFRSSPYGCTGHSLANQNAFNIFYGGKPIFYSTGYRISFSDPHSILSYRNTRAHNSVLIDGLAQKIGVEGYGWIPRALDGNKISYLLGDASNAYGKLVSELWLGRMAKYDIEPSIENGFGDAGMKKFRRHIAMLHPNTIVIYDELEASKPVTWSWLLQGREKLSIDSKNNVVYGENNFAKAKANIYSLPKLKTTIINKFFSPAINWKKRTDSSGNLLKCENQWHAYTENTAKTSGIRFLSVIQVADKSTSENFKSIKRNDGLFEVDGWKINAQLNPEKPAHLLITSPDKTSVLVYGQDNFEISNKEFSTNVKGATLLIEKQNGKWQTKEAIDELPDAAK